jgi:hypothetical protein
LRLNFTKKKQYNLDQIDGLFNKIDNPTLLNTKEKNDINEMLGLFEFSY